MPSTKIATLLHAGVFSLLAAFAAEASPALANTPDCGDLPSALAHDPLRGAGVRVVDTNKLYRVQERPWAQIPTGAKILVSAPSGITGADLQRAAMCSADSASPLSVPGATVRVVRRGDLYEISVTSEQRSAARDIQARVDAL